MVAVSLGPPSKDDGPIGGGRGRGSPLRCGGDDVDVAECFITGNKTPPSPFSAPLPPPLTMLVVLLCELLL